VDPRRDLADLHRRVVRDRQKKLVEAARHWALGGRSGTEEIVADLERWGAPAELLEAWRDNRDEEDEPFDVHPEAWDAVRLLCGSATQWRTAGMSGLRVGLDYAGVAIVAQAHGIAIDAGLMARLQVVEVEALKVWAENRDE